MPIFGFIGGVGPTELVLVLIIVLVLFGAGRLPQVFEQFGKGIKSFRDAQKEKDDDAIDVTHAAPKALPKPDEDPVSEAEEVREKKKTG
jgi:sec-independent protein translocase protein TatA